MKTATPNIDNHTCKRTYLLKDNTIEVYGIPSLSFEGCGLDGEEEVIYNIVKNKKPLFIIKLPCPEAAEAVMEDLYHGEYTGA